MLKQLPVPKFLERQHESDVYLPDAHAALMEGVDYRTSFSIWPAYNSPFKVGMFVIDNQCDFVCTGGAISLAPKSVLDNQRLCRFIAKNLRVLTDLFKSRDEHLITAIHGALFWEDNLGRPPAAHTDIHSYEVGQKWHVSPWIVPMLYEEIYRVAKVAPADALGWLREFSKHYTESLQEQGKPPLHIWPYHCPAGSIGAADTPLLTETIAFAQAARGIRLRELTKGLPPLVERYNPFAAEVTRTHEGWQLDSGEDELLTALVQMKLVIGAGQALSHCFGGAVESVLAQAKKLNPELRIYVLEDCTSTVPGFEQQASKLRQELEAGSVHFVPSTLPMEEWPDMPLEVLEAANAD